MLYRSTDRLCRRGRRLRDVNLDKDAPSKPGIKHLDGKQRLFLRLPSARRSSSSPNGIREFQPADADRPIAGHINASFFVLAAAGLDEGCGLNLHHCVCRWRARCPRRAARTAVERIKDDNVDVQVMVKAEQDALEAKRF